jgi:hypothetical protein
MNKKSKVVLLSAILASELVFAGGDIDQKAEADLTAPVFTEAPYKYVKKPITVDDGSFHGYLRAHHIFNGTDNGYDKVTGSTLGLGLGYGMEVASGLKIGAEFYGVMDSGLTDTDEKLIAYGQFMNTIKSPDELDAGYTWGAHIRYEGEGFKAQLARSQFKSPMTKIQITHVPNMYEYARVDGKVWGGNASLAYISKMSYGSRSAADWGLIGEFTGTAGMYAIPFDVDGAGPKPYLKRGTYYSIEDTLKAGTTDSNGMFVAGYEKKTGMLNFEIWDFLIDDVANNLYAQGTYKWPLGKGKAVKVSAHVWNQDISNSAYEDTYGGTLLGAQALLKWGPVVAKLAYETKDDGGLLNAWGSNPGYTSSIFSRNEYRSNVDAYKATLVWMPLKGLKFVASYADYGQSDMMGGKYGMPTDDADELDLVVIYKPRPDVTLKLFNANRTSEYNSDTVERTQNHTRLIMNFAF